MKIQYPANFGDEYPVEQRPGTQQKLIYGNATVRGIKILPEGTELTVFIPITGVVPDEAEPPAQSH